MKQFFTVTRYLLVAAGVGLAVFLTWKYLTIFRKADSHDLKARVAEYGSQYIREGKSPGIAIAVVQGSHMYYYCAGVANKKTGQPVESNTVFEIGSLTQMFTVQIGQVLSERGVVDWKETLYHSLPYYLAPSMDDSTTLMDLATHTAGFPRLPKIFRDSMLNVCNPYKDITASNYSNYVRSPPDKKKPTGMYEHSSVGYSILGDVLELKTNSKYGKLLYREICQPLGLHNTSLKADTHSLATGYDEEGVKTCHWTFPRMYAAGAICSSLQDMSVFLKSQVLEGEPLHRTFKKTHVERVSFPFGGVGMGWNIDKVTGRLSGSGDLIWHDGSTGGFSCYLGFLPEKKTGIVVLTNQSNAGLNKLALKLITEAARVSLQ